MYFEDFEVGMVFDEEIEDYTFTEEEIIESGRKYDPRPIHIDKEAANKSRFKGLIASGSYANMVFWGQWVKTGIDASGIVAGYGVDEGRWIKPIYPDVTYNIKVEVVNKEVRKEGENGLVTTKLTAYNPDGEPVLTYTATALVNFKVKE